MENKEKKRGQGLLSTFWNVQESGVVVVTVLFVILITIVNSAFMSSANLTNVFRSTGFTLVTAIGMTLVFISGGLDISVGSTLAVGSTVTALGVKAGQPPVLAIILGLLSGLVIGMFNGITIISLKIPPLIVTLGTQYAGRGIVYVLTEGVAVYPLTKEFQRLEQGNVFGIPQIALIAFMLAIIAHIVLTRTTFGRSVYAVGGNKEAARLSGINLNRVSIACYAITGVCAAFAGIMMASRLGSGQASSGEGYEMTVIAAVIIGGTSATGGAGTILGTTIGALFMNILENSMTLMRISVYWQKIVLGLILILAVIFDQYKRNRAMRVGMDQLKAKAAECTGQQKGGPNG
ncbi:MAG: ABC transporter permease [Fastidiosipilaceae bacterium]|jgi:ribose transport system permease protein